MDEIITLKDGTRFLNSHILTANDMMFLYIQDENATMHDVFLALDDPEKTAEITVRRYGEDKVYKGYTDLMSIGKEPGVQISAVVRRASV